MTHDHAILATIAELRIKVEEKEKTIINLNSANNSLAEELNKTKQQLAEVMNQTANAKDCIKLVDQIVDGTGKG